MPKYFIKKSQLFSPQHLLIAGGIKKYRMAFCVCVCDGEGDTTVLEACKKSSSIISLGKYFITSQISGTCASVWSGNFISFPITAISFPLLWKHFRSPNDQYNCNRMKQKGLPIRGADCLFSQALFSFTLWLSQYNKSLTFQQSILSGTLGINWKPAAGFRISKNLLL